MKRLALHTAIVLATLAALAVVWELRDAILIFFLSLATAAAMRPLVVRLAENGLPRALALGLAYLGLIAILAGGLFLIAAPLGGELQRVGDDFVHAYDQITLDWPQGTELQRKIARRLPPPDEIFDSVVGEGEATVVGMLLGMTAGLFGVVVNLVVVLVLSVYWSIDRVKFERLWLSLLPVDYRLDARDIWRAIETEVGAYLRSEVVQSFVAGCLLGAGYWAIGLPYPALLGVVGALAWFIPWVGMLVAVTAVGILSLPTLVLMQEPTAAIRFVSAAVYTLFVLMLLELLIEPRLFNRRRYNSLLIAVIVISLVIMIGALGLVLGPPLAAAIQILFSRLLRQRATAVVAEGSRPVSFSERVSSLQLRIAQLAAPAPELNSLADRLAKLVDDAEKLTPASAKLADRPDSEAALPRPVSQ